GGRIISRSSETPRAIPARESALARTESRWFDAALLSSRVSVTAEIANALRRPRTPIAMTSAAPRARALASLPFLALSRATSRAIRAPREGARDLEPCDRARDRRDATETTVADPTGRALGGSERDERQDVRNRTSREREPHDDVHAVSARGPRRRAP